MTNDLIRSNRERSPCDPRGQQQSDVATSQGTCKAAGAARGRTDPPLEPLDGAGLLTP